VCLEYSLLKKELDEVLIERPGDNIGRYLLQYQLEPIYRELLLKGVMGE